MLSLGSLQNGDVGVGIFPEGEEILISGSCFGGVALHREGSPDLQMRECANGGVQHNPAVVENFLEFGNLWLDSSNGLGRFLSVPSNRRQSVGLAR